MLNLVTNGTSFVASHLVDALVARGQRVIVAGDLRVGKLENIEGALRSGLATFVYVDQQRSGGAFRDTVVKAARRRSIGRIFHVTAAPAASRNAERTRRFDDPDSEMVSAIDVAAAARARFILTVPGDVDADRPAGRAQSYGTHPAYEPIARRGVDGRIVRLSGCYGPRMADADDPYLMALARAVVTGTPVSFEAGAARYRPMIYIADAVNLLLVVADTAAPGGVPHEICGSTAYSSADVSDAVMRAARSRLAQLRAASFIRSAAGPPGETPLDDGVLRTLEWLRETSSQFPVTRREAAIR